MADIATLQSRLNQLRTQLANVLATRSSLAASTSYIGLQRQASSLRFVVDGTVPRSQQEQQTARQQLVLVEQQLASTDARIDAADAEISRLTNEIRQGDNQLAALTLGAPPVSSGDVVQEEQKARANGATEQIPAAASQVLQGNTVTTAVPDTTPSNAQSSTAGVVTTTAPPLTLPDTTQPAGTTGDLTQAPQTAPVSVDALQNGPTLQPTQSFIYKAISVISIFEKGRFTQELEGRLLIFPYDTSTVGNGQRETTSAEAAQNTVSAGNMRAAPRTSPTGLPGTGLPQPEPIPGGTATLGPAQTSPATSQGQSVGVFDWTTVGQGTSTSPAGTSPAGTGGFDWATVGTTGPRSNQQLNRET